MMGVTRPRYGLLSMDRFTPMTASASWFPWGMTQGNSEGITFPESVRLLSAQNIGEATTLDAAANAACRLQVWKNTTGTLVFQPTDLFIGNAPPGPGRLGWRRQIDNTPSSAANAIFKGEDTGSPDKLLCKAGLVSNTSGVMKWNTPAIHYRYLLNDFASVGNMGVTRPRWIVVTVFNLQQTAQVTWKPFGGELSSVKEGTSTPTSVRWRSAQVVCWCQTPVSDTIDPPSAAGTVDWDTYKNTDDGANEILQTSVDITTAGMKRDYSKAVVDDGSERFAGEDASSPDELLSSLITTVVGDTGPVINSTTMCLHGQALP